MEDGEEDGEGKCTAGCMWGWGKEEHTPGVFSVHYNCVLLLSLCVVISSLCKSYNDPIQLRVW